MNQIINAIYERNKNDFFTFRALCILEGFKEEDINAYLKEKHKGKYLLRVKK